MTLINQDFSTIVINANGKASARTLDAATIGPRALSAYAKGVEWCEAMGLPFSSIRIEITGGEKLANSYGYRAEMTFLSFDGVQWTAGRCPNKKPLTRGEVYLSVPADVESEKKALAAKAKAAGLKSRKDGVVQMGTTGSGELRYVDAVSIFAA